MSSIYALDFRSIGEVPKRFSAISQVPPITMQPQATKQASRDSEAICVRNDKTVRHTLSFSFNANRGAKVIQSKGKKKKKNGKQNRVHFNI